MENQTCNNTEYNAALLTKHKQHIKNKYIYINRGRYITRVCARVDSARSLPQATRRRPRLAMGPQPCEPSAKPRTRGLRAAKPRHVSAKPRAVKPRII